MAKRRFTGPRPWTWQATTVDIRPGVILSLHILEDVTADKIVRTETFVVVSDLNGSDGSFYVITKKESEQFTLEQIKSGELATKERKRLAAYMGIMPLDGRWAKYLVCTVHGHLE